MFRNLKWHIRILKEWYHFYKMSMISIELYRRAKLREDDEMSFKWANNAFIDVQNLIDCDLPFLTNKFFDIHDEILTDICRTRHLNRLYGRV